MKKTKNFRQFFLLTSLAFSLSTSALAGEWPEKPLRLVVPFPAGGGADSAARTYAKKLGDVLKQSVIIENKPGATGNIGVDTVLRAPADGYTLLFMNDALSANPSVMSVRYDPLKDFLPIVKVASNNVAIATHPSIPAANLTELIELSKTKELSYATPGIGSSPHLLGELIALETGAKLRNIPYKGSAPATTDAVGGQVDLIISTLAPMVSHIKSGKLNAIAVTDAQRSSDLPGTPTIKESNTRIAPFSVWYGVFISSNTDTKISERLINASRATLSDPEVIKTLTLAGFDVHPIYGPDFFKLVASDFNRWKTVANKVGIKLEN